MPVQRTSSNLLFIGVLVAIGGVYVFGRLLLDRAAEGEPRAALDARLIAPAEGPGTSGLPRPPERADGAAAPGWSVRGRLALPEHAPEDPTLALRVRPRAPDPLFEPWNPPDWSDAGEGELICAPVAADGTFALELPSHWERAWLELDGRWLYLDEPLELAPASESADPARGLALEPRLGARVHGRLVAADGAPLDERLARRARVSAVPDLDALRDAVSQGGLDSVVTERLSTRPADDGRYELRGVPPETSFLVAPVAEGLLPGEATHLHTEPGATVELDFAMTPGRTVAGRVVDPDGVPLAGVHVAYRGDLDRDGFAPLFGRWSVVDDTDENGRFALAGLPLEGRVRLVCELDDWRQDAPLVVELADADGVEQRAVLRRGRVLAGRVLWADGSPAPGFEVGFRRDGETVAEVVTDERGAFRCAGLERGAYAVTVQGCERLGPGRARQGRMRVETPAEAGVEWIVTLAGGHTLAGEVRDAGGEGLRAFELAVLPLEPVEGRTGIRVPFDEARGAFTLEGLAPGRWSVAVTAPDHVVSPAQELELPAPDGEPFLTFELVSTGGIAGVVVDPDGRALPGAHLRRLVSWREPSGDLRTGPGGAETEGRTDAYGRFQLADLAPGTHTLMASAPGFASSATVDVVVPAGNAVSDVELRLRVGGTLVGRLLDGEDEPIAGRFVSVARADFLDARTGRTDDDGRFAFERLEPGPWRVYALPRDGADDASPGLAATPAEVALSRRVDVLDGEVTEVTLGGRPLPVAAPDDGLAGVAVGADVSGAKVEDE